MNPILQAALKPLFLGTQQENDQPSSNTDRSALEGVLKHWAAQYYFCSRRTGGHITGPVLI